MYSTLQMTELDFWLDVTLSRWRTWRHFRQKIFPIWWVHTQHCIMLLHAALCSSVCRLPTTKNCLRFLIVRRWRS